MDSTRGRLACFELWGGNCTADHPVELPGLAGWIYSAPLDPACGGGDVYYFSVCSQGRISRVVVADVAGHGSRARRTAESLHSLLQRYTNNWDQSALMRELNDAFARDSAQNRFATAAVLGFYSETGELLVSSAGHPPPLWYRSREKSWHFLEDCTPFAVDIEGLPLGLIPGTGYSQTAVRLVPGDMLILYTDGITEAIDSAKNQLGQLRLLNLVRTSAAESALEVVRAVQAGVEAFRGKAVPRDDETLVVLRRADDMTATSNEVDMDKPLAAGRDTPPHSLA